jgi:DNA-binding FadR family transcriptional regulator
MTLPMTSSGGVAAIVAELETAITEGTYGHGQRLPAERDLAAHFGASRTTVREALRQLETQALVTRRIGSGTFVNRPAAGHGDIAEMTSPLELMEVREAIEPHLARLAVAHASAKDLEMLDKAIVELESCGRHQETFSKADEAFHLALARATGNPLMAGIYHQINRVRSHDQWNAMKRKVLNATAIDIYNRQHRALVDAIRQRDVDAAVGVVVEHLAKARQDLVGAGPRSAA